MVNRALEAKAELVVGGHRPDRHGAYYEPTVIANPDQKLRDRPGRGLRPGRHRPALLRRGAGDRLGERRQVRPRELGVHRLASRKAMRTARRLQFGTVWINEHFTLASETPHGGVKESGWGKDGSQVRARGLHGRQAHHDQHGDLSLAVAGGAAPRLRRRRPPRPLRRRAAIALTPMTVVERGRGGRPRARPRTRSRGAAGSLPRARPSRPRASRTRSRSRPTRCSRSSTSGWARARAASSGTPSRSSTRPDGVVARGATRATASGGRSPSRWPRVARSRRSGASRATAQARGAVASTQRSSAGPSPGFADAWPAGLGALAAADERPLGRDQSNTSVVLGGSLLLKAYRRVQPGLNPDLELTAFLSEEAAFPGVPRLAGWAEAVTRDGGAATLAMLQAFVAARGGCLRGDRGAPRGARGRARPRGPRGGDRRGRGPRHPGRRAPRRAGRAAPRRPGHDAPGRHPRRAQGVALRGAPPAEPGDRRRGGRRPRPADELRRRRRARSPPARRASRPS